MAKGKLILICRTGGEFATKDDGTMSYNGGEANAANVTSETPFSDLKSSLAETCDLNQETVSVKYFLPGNKRNLITVKNDKDVKRMIEFHGDAITAEVFVMGTPGFIRSVIDTETKRQDTTVNDEPVKNDDLGTKKDEKTKKVKAGPKKEKKVKKDEVAKSPIASPTKRTRRSIAAANAEASSNKKGKLKQKEKEKEKMDSDDSRKLGDTSSSGESEQVNVNVDLDCSPDYVVPSRSSKRKKVNASPADGVKKRKRTPTWKVGANGRPTIVSDSAGSTSKSRGISANKTSQRKSGRLAAKENKDNKSGKKRGRPRAIKSDQEQEDVVGPAALVTVDDDVSPETLVSLWKSAITGVGQQFTSVQEFQETLQRYAVANDFKFKLKKIDKNNKNRVVGECADDGCSWKVNAVWVPSTECFKIKTMNSVHKCDKELTNWLLNTINEKLQESPDLKPKEIANELLKDCVKDIEIGSNRTEVSDAKVISREELHGSDSDSYNKLPWFCEKIMETNPGSFSKLVIGDDKRFKSLFVSFYSSLCGFLNGCRPLLFLEASSLWSKYGEVLITANAIDGNDDFFPVAFAIVDVEDDNNWRWFLEQLKATIFNAQQPITFVFDREKNLKTTILEFFQDCYIGYSIYHLLESFKRNVKGPFHGDGKSFLPFHFLAAAHAVRLVGFKKSTEQIKLISSQAYDWVMQVEPEHWASSSFKGERFNHIIDDVSGPVSKLMEDYQELPILHKIDAIIRTMVDAVNDAKLDGTMWSTQLTPSKEKQLQEESVMSSGLKVLISSDTLFEVREDSTHVVNIGNWSCTCLRWKETGLPCRHALAVFQLIGRDPYEFCSSYFTVDAYRLTYLEPINPVPIEKEEGEKMEIENVRGENEQTLKVEVENEETGEKIENKECEKVEVVDEQGEKMEIEITWGENEEEGKVEGEKGEVEKVEGEKCKIVEDEGVFILPPIPAKTVDVVKEKMDWEETEVETKRTVTCTKCKQPGHNKKSCNLYQLQQQEAC